MPRTGSHKRRSVKGFTLTELLIVIAVVAVLAAVALPMYQDSTRKSRRAAVKAEMLEYVQAAERFRTTNNTFVGFALPTNFSPRERNAATAFYQLAIGNLATASFTITATPINGQASDVCGTLTINQANVKTNSSGDFNQCW
ncbi:MAG: prepilin-type N-terminal cleavage/methylation domain-containing protein [Xanthomonadaceae bacterium]|nr:prepilin-type N-terminal cleavage/methylation domain-containing protein [Xanthomonadaceae bacterium]